MDPVNLTEQFISIPSYVSSTCDESRLALFIEKVFKQNFAPSLKMRKQYIDQDFKRYNLLFAGNNPKILIVCHMDTVLTQTGWDSEPCKPIIKNNSLYGLGACDMKGSTCSFISALINLKKNIDLDKIAFLFYVDEEYDFKGMKRFVQDFDFGNQLKLILSLEGGMRVKSGCRGCIEFTLKLKGQSAHSARPFQGVNAVMKTYELINLLEQEVEKYVDINLGQTTLNVSYLQGGSLERIKNKSVFRREGNIVAEYAESIIEIRNSKKELDAERIKKYIYQFSDLINISVEDIEIRHDLKPWDKPTDSNTLETVKEIYQNTGIEFENKYTQYSSYVDVQMIAEKTDTPILVIGAGGRKAHAPNENISIRNLQKAENLYSNFLLEYAKK